jgi:hypothetical protein
MWDTISSTEFTFKSVYNKRLYFKLDKSRKIKQNERNMIIIMFFFSAKEYNYL